MGDVVGVGRENVPVVRTLGFDRLSIILVNRTHCILCSPMPIANKTLVVKALICV